MHESVIVNPKLAASILPHRSDHGHKGSFGTLLSVCGSRDMPGAACLSAMAALRCGVGLVMLASVPSVISVAQSRMLEPVYITLMEDKDGHIAACNAKRLLSFTRPTAILTGCGLGTGPEVTALVASLSENSGLPTVIDADGLNCLCGSIELLQNRKADTVLTPHMGELSRLLEISTRETAESPLKYGQKLSDITGAVTVAKSHVTNIISDTKNYLLDAPNSGLAKGGSGDVLAGCIASFMAQGINAADAAVLGVYVHSAAGKRAAERLGKRGMLPTDIIEEIPYILKELEDIQK